MQAGMELIAAKELDGDAYFGKHFAAQRKSGDTRILVQTSPENPKETLFDAALSYLEDA